MIICRLIALARESGGLLANDSRIQVDSLGALQYGVGDAPVLRKCVIVSGKHVTDRRGHVVMETAVVFRHAHVEDGPAEERGIVILVLNSDTEVDGRGQTGVTVVADVNESPVELLIFVVEADEAPYYACLLVY